MRIIDRYGGNIQNLVVSNTICTFELSIQKGVSGHTGHGVRWQIGLARVVVGNHGKEVTLLTLLPPKMNDALWL